MKHVTELDAGRRPNRSRGRIEAVSAISLLLMGMLAAAETPAEFDAARAFGARESMWALSLSPDGTRVAYVVPAKGQGTTLLTVPIGTEDKPKAALYLDGNPFRLLHCQWVSSERLVCQIRGVIKDSSESSEVLPVSRWIAVNSDGTNQQTLATHRSDYSRGYLLQDGDVIDYLPDEDGAVLMSRRYTPDAHLGSRTGSDEEGVGVDWVDTRTLKIRNIISPRKDAFEYLSDGRGTVRVMGLAATDGRGYQTGKLSYYYRPMGKSEWRPLSQYDQRDGSGLRPVAVDHDLNVAYGFRRTEGHISLFEIKLDESREEHLVYARPDVDVGGLLRIGRERRVVGATYVTDRAQFEAFDSKMKALLGSLAKALPEQPLIAVTDASADESKLVVMAGADSDPGVYYLFDRKSHHLDSFNVVRHELEGIKLAKVKSVTYPSSDGVMIPAYLTLPSGLNDARRLPAIVLPHGGPSARDEWGFDWLSQYFAYRGYAVLQPEFRGSAGYGDVWSKQNGFKSWRVAVGDVLAAGRWLVTEGIADPRHLGVLGWSYGGYAALQSAVLDPSVFKAVVAIAPVTDLSALVEEHREWSDYEVIKDFVGTGPHTHDGSPIEHAAAFKVPVLLFHGTFDRNVVYQQSKRLAEKLKVAGAHVELVTFPNLDHQLEDSAARAEMLQRSDDFLRAAFR